MLNRLSGFNSTKSNSGFKAYIISDSDWVLEKSALFKIYRQNATKEARSSGGGEEADVTGVCEVVADDFAVRQLRFGVLW